MATKKVTADEGRLAVEKVKPLLLALENDRIVQPTTDLQAAAIAALLLVDRARASDFSSKIEILPKAFFDKGNVGRLEDVANATMHIAVESSREEAASSGFKVDVAIAEEATAVRGRMLKTAEYNLGDDDAVARELADIRSGTGYLDLANDLTRLALLYSAHRAELSADTKHYDAADGAHANKLAAQIREAYRTATGKNGGAYAELRARAYTELTRLYNDIRATAEFVLRDQPEAVGQFLALRTSAKAIGTSRRAKRHEDAGSSPAPAMPKGPDAPSAPAANAPTAAPSAGQSSSS